MICQPINGLHTYSAGMVLTYEQYKKVNAACRKTGCIDSNDNEDACIFDHISKLCCYKYHQQGLKVHLYAVNDVNAMNGRIYRLSIQIEPCRVLQSDDPTELFTDVSTYPKMVKRADKLLKELAVPLSIDKMKISRCDITMNLIFQNEALLKEYLRILQKGFTPPLL